MQLPAPTLFTITITSATVIQGCCHRLWWLPSSTMSRCVKMLLLRMVLMLVVLARLDQSIIVVVLTPHGYGEGCVGKISNPLCSSASELREDTHSDPRKPAVFDKKNKK